MVSDPLPLRRETAGPQETEALGAALAATLQPGDVVLVMGEVGSGKTTFVRGACRALGVQVPVTSPTFTLANRYAGREVEVAHLDLYRLDALAAEEPGLLADELSPDGIAFVEWPDAAIPDIEPAARVSLEHVRDDRRVVRIER